MTDQLCLKANKSVFSKSFKKTEWITFGILESIKVFAAHTLK